MACFLRPVLCQEKLQTFLNGISNRGCYQWILVSHLDRDHVSLLINLALNTTCDGIGNTLLGWRQTEIVDRIFLFCLCVFLIRLEQAEESFQTC